MDHAPGTIIVFFDLIGVIEEFSHLKQTEFDLSLIEPGSSYAEDGVAALNAAARRWQAEGHEVFLVCVSGIRGQFTRTTLAAYLAMRGFDADALRLHEQHNAPKDESEDAPPTTKGQEVELWLAGNRWDAFVVFDDFNDGYRKGFYVFVDPDTGLAPENVETAQGFVRRQLAAAATR